MNKLVMRILFCLGLANDLGNSTDQIFNDALATSQSVPFSPWSNTVTALANPSLQSTLSSTSLNASQFSIGYVTPY